MSATVAMNTLKVRDLEYAYLDSGAPKSNDYTTWIIIHGLGFNGGVFKKLLPIAPNHNLRIVSLYRRGYPPTSNFREGELAGLGRGKKFEEVEPFLRSQADEIATFLVTFAKEQGIPPAHPNRPTGGIALIGWSLGETRSSLGKYLHTILAYDQSAVAFGIPYPEGYSNKIWLKKDARDRMYGFFEWVTSHFEHKSVTSGKFDDLRFDASDKPHSMHELSPDQVAELTCVDPLHINGCDSLLISCDVSAFRILTKRAIFDKSLAQYLPNLRVRYMCSPESGGLLVWAMWMLKKHLVNPKEFYGDDAEKARDIKCIIQDEGNHFIFWEDAEKAIQQYTATINL